MLVLSVNVCTDQVYEKLYYMYYLQLVCELLVEMMRDF